MLYFTAQADFLKAIQSSFERGYSSNLMLTMLLWLALAMIPLLVGVVVWQLRHLLIFFARRQWNQIFQHDARVRVAAHLRDRRLPLDVFLPGQRSNRLLFRVNLVEHGLGRFKLAVLDDVPASWRRNLMNKRVLLRTRPFRFGGQKLNSFYTFVRRTSTREGRLGELVVLTPDHYIYSARRRHKRMRLARPEAVRFRIWDGAKKATFLMAKPDFESEEPRPDVTWKPVSRVVNISEGGLRLNLAVKHPEQTPKLNTDLVVELTVMDPANKRFHKFLVLAAVRSVFRLDDRSVGLGLEFIAEAARTASRQVEWTPVYDSVKPVADLLHRIRPEKKPERPKVDLETRED
ncbi:MAG: hypothetical protein AB7D57_08035 [Desulfovibrionaceae bacterium]